MLYFLAIDLDMHKDHSTIIVIPARLQSTRLPNKPLADIHGKPMIVHCMERAQEADIAPVIVAASDQEIVDVVEAAGGVAVLTDPNLPSGSDRIYQAIEKIDKKGQYDIILNMQGDLPLLPAEYLRILHQLLQEEAQADFSSLVSPMGLEEAKNPNIVKAIAGIEKLGDKAYGLAFSRAIIPWHEPENHRDRPTLFLHHIGLYGWRRNALSRFVSLPPSWLEKRERLEQMRALEAGMRLILQMVPACPAGVDTMEELEAARIALTQKIK